MKVWTKVIVVGILVMVVATGLLTACGKDSQASLRERAVQWSALLESLPTGDEEQDVKHIESFLEPSTVRTERAREYYKNWTQTTIPAKTVQSSVDDVSISSDGKSGTVRITDVLEWQGEEILGMKKGDRSTRTEIINWKLIGKTWYRTMEAAEIK